MFEEIPTWELGNKDADETCSCWMWHGHWRQMRWLLQGLIKQNSMSCVSLSSDCLFAMHQPTCFTNGHVWLAQTNKDVCWQSMQQTKVHIVPKQSSDNLLSIWTVSDLRTQMTCYKTKPIELRKLNTFVQHHNNHTLASLCFWCHPCLKQNEFFCLQARTRRLSCPDCCSWWVPGLK